MYICICHAITENHIVAAVEDGAADVDDLGVTLGLGSCCGSCVDQADSVLRQHTDDSTSPATAAADRPGVRHYVPA